MDNTYDLMHRPMNPKNSPENLLYTREQNELKKQSDKLGRRRRNIAKAREELETKRAQQNKD